METDYGIQPRNTRIATEAFQCGDGAPAVGRASVSRPAVERIDDLVEFIRMECAPLEAATELMRSALEVRNDLSLMLDGFAR